MKINFTNLDNEKLLSSLLIFLMFMYWLVLKILRAGISEL
jgi:hypothetical protein